MTRSNLNAVLLLLLLTASSGLRAQDPPAEPKAQTEPAAQPATATPRPEEQNPAAIDPAVRSSPPDAPAQAPEAIPGASRRFKTMDRLELDRTAITGNRELPKVLYIVPWKKADLGDLVGRPANSLLDEVLAPVDREVFRRQTDYFTKLNTDAAAGAAGPEPAPVPPGQR